jgi:Uma2 family endonuclease
MAGAPLTIRRWTRAEYERLVDLGAFRGDPVELIGGQLVVAEPQGAYHASAVSAADRALQAAVPSGWLVRAQLPVALDDDSVPEPDLAVVRGSPSDYRDAHPARPALVVEIADTSLEFDRRVKAGLYARAGVAEYWIVDLAGRALEVHREPVADAAAPYGWRYGAVQRLAPPAGIAPLALPGARIAVAALLP